MPTVEFDRAVRLSVSGIEAGKFKDADGEQYAIVVRTPVGARADLDALGEVRVPTMTGALAAAVAAGDAASSSRRPSRSRATTASARSRSTRRSSAA